MPTMKWIKLSSGLFEDDKLILLEQHRDGQLLQLLWIKLLCLAGKQGRGGVFLLREGIPYTPAMLSTVFRMEPELVERGLEVFRQFGMVEDREGAIAITNWNRHQSLSAYEKKLNYDREYRKAQRSAVPLYGCEGNVPLTEEQYQALRQEFPQDYDRRIDRLSAYMAQSGKTYSDPVAVIRSWAREDAKKEKPKRKRSLLELALEDL